MGHSSTKSTAPPFAMIRHDFVADSKLSDADVRVLLALMYWTHSDKPDCWPCVESIMRRVHKKERAVQIALRNLEHHGYIRFEPDPSKRTRRRIVLVWKADGKTGETKEGDSPRKLYRDRAAKARGTSPTPHRCAPKEDPILQSEVNLDRHPAHASHSELEITLPPILETVGEAGEPNSEDRQRANVMTAIPALPEVRGRQQVVMINRTANLIAGLFLDEHSLDFHRSVLWRVAKGKLASQIVIDAFVATYDKIAEHNIGDLGRYFVGCLRNMIGDEAINEFLAEFKADRERAKREYGCEDANLIGEVA